jgi:hypothetical protein
VRRHATLAAGERGPECVVKERHREQQCHLVGAQLQPGGARARLRRFRYVNEEREPVGHPAGEGQVLPRVITQGHHALAPDQAEVDEQFGDPAPSRLAGRRVGDAFPQPVAGSGGDPAIQFVGGRGPDHTRHVHSQKLTDPQQQPSNAQTSNSPRPGGPATGVTATDD